MWIYQFFFLLQNFLLDNYWFNIFAWYQLLWSLHAPINWRCYSASLFRSTRLCRRKSIATLCTRSRSTLNTCQIYLTLAFTLVLASNNELLIFNILAQAVCVCVLSSYQHTHTHMPTHTLYTCSILFIHSLIYLSIKMQRNLLLSILPAHTASALENAVLSMIENIRQERLETAQQLNAKR